MKTLGKSARKIAFVGHKDAINFHKIGGTDAIVRRLATVLAQTQEVYVLTYADAEPGKTKIGPNITHIRCLNFDTLLVAIEAKGITDAVTIYLRGADRLKLIWRSSSARFHTILTTYNSKPFKRWILFLLSFSCFNGVKFVVSERLYKALSVWSKHVVLLWPPVQDEFFLKPEPKPKDAKRRISYMGRLDWGKGADIAVQFFETTGLDPELYEFFVYGYPWKDNPFSMSMHNQLLSHPKITYVEATLVDDLGAMDRSLRSCIDDTDVFLLPYREMLSTIDSPLVPMEVVARGKPYVTTDIEGLPDLPLIGGIHLSVEDVKCEQNLRQAVLQALDQKLPDEPNLVYSASNVVDCMLNAISKVPAT